MSKANTYIPVFLTLGCIGVIMIMRRKSNSVTSLINDYNSNYDMSTDPKLPRGYRNNNPLNIRISKNTWKGKIADNTDGVFEQFVDMAYGYRAALATMRTYITKYGLDTVQKIIERWAPANENNTLAYIQHVCEWANLTPETKVARNDKDTLTKMAYAMSIVENGNKEYTRLLGLPNMEIINEGWRLL